MSIDFLEKICINNAEQWLLIRGKRKNAPLIIQVQAGPGFPMISEARSVNKALNWEEDFLVAYWDHRGCGKSYNRYIMPESITLTQLSDDVIECTRYLLNRYKKNKAILVGYSIGATIALMAASKADHLFHHLFLVGMDIDVPSANQHAIRFARNKALEQKKDGILNQIIDLEWLSVKTPALFEKRARIISDLGGIITKKSYSQLFFDTLTNMLFCRHYNILDIFRTIKGMKFCQKALLPEMATLNLFECKLKTDIPTHFIQGRNDGISPFDTAKRYYEFLPSNYKTFTVFEDSAHMPHLEEPQKFYSLIKDNISKYKL